MIFLKSKPSMAKEKPRKHNKAQYTDQFLKNQFMNYNFHH